MLFADILCLERFHSLLDRWYNLLKAYSVKMEGDDSIQGKPLWYCAAKGRPEINKENHSENS